MKAFLFASACSVLGLLPLLAGSVTVESEYFTVDTTAKLTVVPTSCNWQQGSITIGWASNYTSANKPTYTVYWANSTNNFESEGFFSDSSNVTEIRAGILGNSFTDDQYYKRGDGTQIIYYCVKGSDGSKGCCATRRRFGLFLGFTGIGVDSSASEAREFAQLFKGSDAVVAHPLIDGDNDSINESFDYFSKEVSVGDVFLFFVCSHGTATLSGRFDGFECSGYFVTTYTTKSLKSRLNAIGSKGAAVVSVLNTCGAGQIASDCGSDFNKSWLSGTSGKQSGISLNLSISPYTLFGRALIYWGWKSNEAESDGSNRVSFYSLGKYAADIVKGCGSAMMQTPSVRNDRILRNITAFKKSGGHSSRLGAPSNVRATTDLINQIRVTWSPVSGADYYILKWCKVGTKDYDEWVYLLPEENSYVVPEPEDKGWFTTDKRRSRFIPDCNLQYQFVMTSVNCAGEGTQSDPVIGKSVLSNNESVTIDGLVWSILNYGQGVVVYQMSLDPAVSAFAPVDINIPAQINGSDVVGIASSVFSNYDKVSSVTVPSTIFSLGECAFEGCNSLSTVTFTGEMPSGLNESGLISTSVKIKYPRRYANQYAEVISPEQFGGYSDAGEYEAATMTLGSEGVFSPTDTDGDGRNDKLIVSTQIETDKGGNYNWSAELATANGEEIVIATGEIQLAVGVNESAFAFDGTDILNAGLAGPYVVKNVIIWNDDDFVQLQGNLISDEIPMDSWWLKLFVRTDGDDSADGKSLIRAKGTIQAAVDAAEESTIVVVYPGTYSPFTVNDGQLKIVSSEGSTATCIDAAGVTRCATLGSSVGDTNVVLKGFTLRNGNANGAFAMRYYGGGVCYGTLVDCVLVNNVARMGGGAYDASLFNCSIVGNRGWDASSSGAGGGIYWGHSGFQAKSCYIADNLAYNGSAIYLQSSGACTLSDSLVVRNTALFQGALHGVAGFALQVLNCTVTDNNCTPYYRPGALYVSGVDSILHGNYTRRDISDYSYNAYRCSLANCCTTVEGSTCSGTGIVAEAPAFVDSERRVYDLLAPSGENIVGAGKVVDTNGMCTVGLEIDGHGVVTRPGTVVDPGDSLTFTAEETGRVFEGFYTNGVFATNLKTLVLENIRNDILVTARFAKRVAYVAANGNDSNDGLSAESPKRSIDAAFPLVENGESIEVGPGTYGVITLSGYSSKGKSVRIYSTHGAGQTIIDGGHANTCANLSDFYDGTTNVVLEGFSLINGYTADNGGGALYGTLVDCVIADNSAERYGGGAYYSRLVNCVVCRNKAGIIGGGIYEGAANLCTICANEAGVNGGGTGYGTLNKSIVSKNLAGGGENNCYYATSDSCCTYPNRGTNPITGDPLLVDGWNGDARLRVGSPCIVNGVQVCGANVGDPVEGISVSVGVQGAGAATNSATLVASGSNVTIEATETVRPFLYWDINGDRISSRVYTIENVTSDVRAIAVFGTRDWYVDAECGDDSADGTDWSNAKQSIQAAVSAAVDDEIIYVEAGTYDPISTDNKRIRIEGVNGAEMTFIDGAGVNRCATLGSMELHQNTVLVGFTLVNGCAPLSGSYAYGGGSYAGTLENCIISNCLANAYYAYGGGAYGGCLNNCLVANNTAMASSSAYGGGTFRSALYSCTIARNTAVGSSSAYGGGAHGDYYSAYNSIIWGNEVRATAASNAYYPNACYQYLYYCDTDTSSSYLNSGTITDDPLFVDADAGDFHLRAGSPCLNAGHNSYVQGEVDLDWDERIQGGRVDMGCYEGAEHSTTPTEVTGVRAANGVIVWDAQPEADGYMIYRSTSRMASSARYIGMSDTNTYVDETAVEGTKYYYWVKAFNTLGMGPMGEASEMLWPDPLEIVTSDLPEGVEGAPYEVQLEATGGTGNYTWRVVSDMGCAEKYAAMSTFESVGSAQGWRADDSIWTYALPFVFAFCGEEYNAVNVGSNGALTFGNSGLSNNPSENYLANNRMIAGYWRDLRTDETGGDIFVDKGEGFVTFRWAATHYGESTPVNFSITLYEDGAVRLSYGSGNVNGAMIGYSAGDGENYYISQYSQSGSMEAADDIWFFANLPPGLKLSEDGLLSGTCSLVWDSPVTISVEDELGEYAEMTYPFVIGENPNARPVINALSPSSDSAVNVQIGETQVFEVDAADPDEGVLNYTWILDGVIQLVPWDSSSFAFSPTMADHGAHTLKCYVSDGYWTNNVFATWQINAFHHIYVDANATTSGSGLTWATAMKSLRAACLYAVDGDHIHVSDGVYEPITTANKAITISSVNGAGSTVIDGGHSNRCAYLSTVYSGTNTVLEGFSLINGYQGGSYFAYGGGSWGGTLNRCVISNCHIVATTGNNGYDIAFGGASYYGVLNNCLIVGNSASSPYTSQGGGTCYSKLVNCTVVGNETSGGATSYGTGAGFGGGVYGGTAYNTIIANNTADTGANAYSAALYYCCASVDSTRRYEGTITDDPQFADAAAGDYRLVPTSPCRGTGDRGFVVGNKDLAGMNRTHGATVNMGCYEEVAFTSVPGVVTGIIASEGIVAWNAQPEAEQYRIYRNASDDFSTASLYRQTAATTMRDSEATETDAPYWYWIVAINPLGEGPVSSATRMVWPRPVVITTESLPSGVENEEYSVQLMAEEGTEPYTWQLMMRGYDFARPRNSFSNVGVAQGWRADDQSWEYELPFDFEFYGVRYKKVYVNSNGYLSFDIPFNSYSWSQDQFVNNRLICGCWRDLYTNQSADSDIFVLRESDAVTFRWSAYSGGAMYNFSITLYSDGRIRLSYGSGNDYGGCVGVSAGDGVNYKFLNWTSSALNQISDVGFTPGALVPANDGMLPQGLTLSNSGVLSGKPTEVFSNDLVVAVTDFNGGTTNRTFELVIAANSNLRPVIESVTPVEEFTFVSADEGGLFSVAASDPESASLIYEWYVDGELVEGEDGPSFLYKPSEFGYDYRELYDHTIECFVSDGFWYGEVVCSWIVRVTRTFYVDASASGERTGETPANAFNSIEEAMYEAQEGDVILVAPGVYEPFSFSGRSITVKAISGSADTIIDCYGGYGLNGPDYWRPYYEEDGYPIQQPVLEGFTIRNGSQAASGVKLVGCRIVDMTDMVADGCQLENCIVTQCESSYYAMIRVCKLTGCTVAGNSVSGYAVGEDSRVYNSIVYGNVTPDGGAANYSQDWYYDWDGTNEIQVASVWFFNSCTSPLPDSNHGNIDADPLLVDCRNGDVRLRLGSPCIDAGSVAYVNCASDIEGNDRIMGTAPDMGAIEGNPVSGCVISAEVIGGGSVTPLTGLVEAGGDMNFIADDSVRPFISFMTNGVWASDSTHFTWRNVFADGTLTAVFSNYTFYVDATNGDDANDGLSWATAKATLQEAIDAAVAGEEIFVAAGEYEPIYTDNKKIKIVGVEGAENTIIDGGGSERCATLSEDSGRVNATLVGFTLQNGWAYYGGGAYGGTLRNCIIKENEAVECGGGCAFSRVYDSQIIDNSVVVPDTVDQYGRYVYRPIYAQGGGAYGGELINCEILRNEVVGNPETRYVYGGGVSESTAIGCVVAENYAFGYGYETSGGGVGNSQVINCTIVKNCVENELTGTFGDDSLADGGGYGGQYYYYCCNSIVFGNVVNGESNDLSARFANNVSACVVGADPGFVDFESGDYALLQGSRCVDGGYTYVYDEWGMPEHDMRGNFRVQGASIDIGAFEVAQEYYIEQTTIDLGSARQDCVIRFRAASDWSVESSASWFAIDDKDGTGSSALQGVVLSVDENASGIERAADLTLHVGASTVIITVRQLAKVELPTATQRYYGLFVGLNEYTYASSLSGCVSDANNMLARCLSHGYWNAENVLALTNERATKDSVREQISQMARTAKAGDVVLFYQSSHGGNVTDPYGNMTDDVYLCEYDTPYYDYELAEDLSAFKAGVKVVILIDACHSGGLFKALNGADAPVRMPTGGFNIARRVQELMRKSSRVKSAAKSEMIDPSEIGWITACDSDQYSYDSPEGGVFTGELLYGWGSGEADEQPFGDGDGYMNFYELFKYAHEYATGYGDTEAQCFNVGTLIRTIVGLSDDFDKPTLPGISEALNATNVAWTTSFGTGWFSQSDVSHDCVSAAQSGAIGNAASSILTGTVSGSGTLSFWWKVSSEENKDYLRFALDGVGIYSVSGDQDWRQVTVVVDGEGEHLLTWTYSKGKSGVAGSDCGWVDEVAWLPDVAVEETEVSLAEALDTTSVAWGTNGDAAWRGVDNGVIDFARSGGIGDNEESILSATLVGPGELSFKWKTSCEEYDGLDLVVDGEIVRWASGETDWMTVALSLSAGSHQVQWVYWKDESDSEGEDCAYIDQVMWQSSAPVTADPIPDIGDEPTPEQVQGALAGSEDVRLFENIVDGDNYNAYRAWADEVELASGGKAGKQAVKDSPNAWLSFALDSATLIQTPPADGDVKVEKFEQAATAGSFDFIVGVENIPVGDDATPSNLAKVFGIEGGSTLSPQDMSSDKVDITFGTPENGKVKFTAGPKDKTQPTFFMKVKVK